MSALERAAADECLSSVFGGQYGDLTIAHASLVIDDLLKMNHEERFGDLWVAATMLKHRIHPASLQGYASTLQAAQR